MENVQWGLKLVGSMTVKGGKLEVRRHVGRWGCARGIDGAPVVGVGLRQYACGFDKSPLVLKYLLYRGFHQ